MKTSIIIPVYNEEKCLAACLSSIEGQTIKPYEVIIVNNNSTDHSRDIAAGFDFAHVIDEPKQGLIAARNAGFAAAKGDILARINADVVLDTRWMESLQAGFERPETGGVTGPAKAITVIGLSWHSTFWAWVYLKLSENYFRVPILWGANMAIRRQAWEAIADKASKDDNAVHEDQDLSLLLAGEGWKVKTVPNMLVYTDGTTYFYWPKFWEYVRRRWQTKRLHRHDYQPTVPLYRSIPLHLAILLPGLVFGAVSAATYYISRLRQLMKRKKT